MHVELGLRLIAGGIRALSPILVPDITLSTLRGLGCRKGPRLGLAIPLKIWVWECTLTLTSPGGSLGWLSLVKGFGIAFINGLRPGSDGNFLIWCSRV